MISMLDKNRVVGHTVTNVEFYDDNYEDDDIMVYQKNIIIDLDNGVRMVVFLDGATENSVVLLDVAEGERATLAN